MKILGIDFGTKRIGLAISDETKSFAREFGILSPKEFWQQIGELVQKEEIEKIVLGLPLNMSGEDSEKTTEVRSFKDKLEVDINLQIEFMDERLSSSMAGDLPGGRKDIDSLAAQIILQNFLDRNKNQES